MSSNAGCGSYRVWNKQLSRNVLQLYLDYFVTAWVAAQLEDSRGTAHSEELK